jgi:general secretion pathway protein H
MARRRSWMTLAKEHAALDSPDSRLTRRTRGSPFGPASPFAAASCLRGPTLDSPLCTGFSLIEILVVTVILAVAAGAVTLAVAGAGGERQLAREADRITALVGYACEQAELSGRDIGLSFNRGGYSFSRSDHAEWLVLRDGELRPRKWSVSADVALTRDGNRVDVGAEFPDKPQLVCFSSGELTAFRLELALTDAAVRYRVEAKPDGDVTSSSLDSRAR